MEKEISKLKEDLTINDENIELISEGRSGTVYKLKNLSEPIAIKCI